MSAFQPFRLITPLHQPYTSKSRSLATKACNAYAQHQRVHHVDSQLFTPSRTLKPVTLNRAAHIFEHARPACSGRSISGLGYKAVRQPCPSISLSIPVRDRVFSHQCRHVFRCCFKTRSSTHSGSPGHDVETRVRQTIHEHGLVQSGDTVVVSVSGGSDSVALLHAFVDLREDLEIKLHVLHFNHKLRDEESDRDEAFVRQLADRYGLPLHVRTREEPFGPSGLQAEARAWRRAESRALLHRLPAQAIALAHHADDQTETILMKWLRGCHLSNLRGMLPQSGPFIRPLLQCSKDQLQSYLKERGWRWEEDSSNESEKYTRNKVRRSLIPLAQEVAQGALGTRLRELADQSSMLRELLDGYPPCFAPPGADAPADVAMHLDLAAWQALPALAQADQLNRFVTGTTGDPLRYSVLQKLVAQIQRDEPIWEWDVSKGWSVQRVGLRLSAVRRGVRPGGSGSQRRGQAAAAPGAPPRALDRAGLRFEVLPGWEVDASWVHPVAEFDDGGASVGVSEEEQTEDRSKQDIDGMLLYNLEPGCSLQIRTRQPGDRFQLHGKEKPRKLKDFLRDQKIPLHLRGEVPLVCMDGRVVAVYPDFKDSCVHEPPAGDRQNPAPSCLRIRVYRTPREQ